MTELERLIRREQARLHRLDDAQLARMGRAYQAVIERFDADLDALMAQIEEAQLQGRKLPVSWLYRQERYTRLLGQFEENTLAFLRNAITQVQETKRTASGMADTAAPPLTVSALGPGPSVAKRAVLDSFSTLPQSAVDRLIANAADGRPLGMLLGEIAPNATEAVRDALSYGIASGKPVREIAADVAQKAQIPRTRAMTISRTEVIRAYRETSSEAFQSSSAVRSWIWSAALDNRTCPACWAKHGTVHPVTEPMESHPCCRCTQCPQTPSWAQLGYSGVPDRRPRLSSGAELFEQLDHGDQLLILGRAKLDAFNTGAITLADVARETNSPRWGKGIRVATLEELGI